MKQSSKKSLLEDSSSVYILLKNWVWNGFELFDIQDATIEIKYFAKKM